MADGSVTIEVTLTKDQLEKGLKSLKSTINNALPSASKTLLSFANGFNKIGSLATSAGKACSTVTASVTGIFTAATLKAKNFITTYEGAINLFKKKLGETGANEMYDSLLKIAKASTFAQESIVSAGQTMVAMGIDGKKTAKYMQLVTDAVAGMGGSGSDIESLAQAIGKMSNQVTLHTDDLNQLATQGLPVWDVLAKKYNKTKEEVQDMASSGLLPAAETLDYLTDALEGNIAGFEKWSVAGNALSQKGGTLKGALDGINSSIRSFGLNLLGMNINKGQLGNYQKLIELVNLFGKTIENIGSKFSFLGDWIGKGLGTAKGVIEKFNTTLNSMSAENLQTVAKVILGIAAAGPGLLTAGKGFNSISGIFNGLGSGAAILESIPSKIVSMSGTIGGLVGKIKSTSSVFTTFFGGINAGFSTIFSGGVLGKFQAMISGLGSSILSSFSTIGSSIGGILSPITSGFTTMLGKVQLITGLGLSKIQNSFGELFDKIAPNFSSGLNKITGTFGGLFGKIGSSIGSFLPIFTKAFNITAIIGIVVASLGLLQDQFGEQIDKLLAIVIQKGPELITNLASGISNKIPELIALGGQLLNKLLGTITSNIPSIIQSGIQIISSLVTGLASQLPHLIPITIQAILTIVTSLIDNIDMLIDAGIQLLIGLTQGIIDSLPIIINKLPDIIIKIVDAIVKNLPKLIEAGVKLVIMLIAGIIQAIPELLKACLDLGKKLISYIWNGISSQTGGFFSKVGEFFAGLIESIKALGMMIQNTLINMWNSIITFFTEGIPNFINSIIEWIQQLPYKIGYFIGEILGYILQFGINAWNWVTQELPKIIEGIINWFAELPSRIWEWLCNVVNNIITWGQNMWNNATTWVANTINGIIDWFKKLPGSVWTWLQNTISKILNFAIDMAQKGKQGAIDLFNNIVNTIKELPGKMLEIGKNIVEGIWNGIKNGGNWIKEKVGNFAKGILDGMKQSLGIHSPSKVFRDQVGKNIALGVGEGFDDNINKVYDKMRASINFETQRLSTNLSTTANVNRNLNVSLNQSKSDVILDGRKVGQSVSPYMSQTLRVSGV